MIPLEMMHEKKFMNQNSYGFDCDGVVGRKRKHRETISGGCKRKNIFGGKRMCNANDKRVKETVGIPDRDYLQFIELIIGSMKEDEQLVEENVNVSDEDDDTVDPQYKIFLENVREDGDAYVLEMKKADGTVDVVKYEEKGEELSEGAINCCVSRGKERKVYEEKGDGAKNGGVSKGKEKEVYEEKGNGASNGGVSKGKEKEVYEDKGEGANNGGVIKGKEKEVYEDKGKGANNGVVSKGKEKEVYEDKGEGAKNGGVSKGKENEVNVPVELKVEDLDGRFVGRKFLSDCPPEVKAGADKNYLEFLMNVWVRDASLTYVHENIIQNLEEDIGDFGVETGSEIPGHSHSSKKFTPHTDPGTSKMVANGSDSDSIEILDSNEKIDYKGVLLKELKAVLQKPFDPKEYMEKLEDAKTRKPLQKSRITRGRVVSYPTKESSPSYLDLHSDLRNMFNRAMQENDPLRALALLRCLFFYYKNVSHPGSFIPWRCPIDWLHDIICSCVDSLNCPMNNASKLYEEL